MEGKCTTCGGEKEDPTFASCEKCRSRGNNSKRLLREKRLREGICIACGKEKAADGKQKCITCADRDREKKRSEREFYKENRICPKCGKNMLWGNEKRCVNCSEKDAEYRNRLQGKRYNAQYAREYRERCRELGICVTCGRRPVKRQGATQCGICAAKKNRRERERRGHFMDRSEYPSYGICYLCCKRPILNGKRLCKECTERVSQNLANAQRGDDSYWRRDNTLLFIRP